jgi:uncharacterized protein (TIGR03067 family)
MRGASLLLVLSAGLVFAAEGGKDLDKLQGTWDRVSGEVDGKPVPADVLKNSKLTISGDKYTLTMGDEKRGGTLVLDATKKPKAIDIISAAGPNKGKALLGIYELDGDTFKYCLAPPGQERPKEFTAKAGSGQMLYVNKKAK